MIIPHLFEQLGDFPYLGSDIIPIIIEANIIIEFLIDADLIILNLIRDGFQ
jgi:hypothetical protein